MKKIFYILIASILGASPVAHCGKNYRKTPQKKAAPAACKKNGPASGKQQKYELKKNTSAAVAQKISGAPQAGKPAHADMQQTGASVNAAKMVTVTNNITDNMITYMDHWAKPYPSKFNLFVNGKIVKKGEQITVPNGDKELCVGYECEFKKFGIMYHQEKKEKKVPVCQLGNSAQVTFSWYTPDRIEIKQCAS